MKRKRINENKAPEAIPAYVHRRPALDILELPCSSTLHNLIKSEIFRVNQNQFAALLGTCLGASRALLAPLISLGKNYTSEFETSKIEKWHFNF